MDSDLTDSSYTALNMIQSRSLCHMAVPSFINIMESIIICDMRTGSCQLMQSSTRYMHQGCLEQLLYTSYSIALGKTRSADFDLRARRTDPLAHSLSLLQAQSSGRIALNQFLDLPLTASGTSITSLFPFFAVKSVTKPGISSFGIPSASCHELTFFSGVVSMVV